MPDPQKKQTIWYTQALREEVREWPKAVKVEIGEELYVAKFEEAVYVLHVITRKKTQKTSQSDIDIAKKRYNALVEARKKQ